MSNRKQELRDLIEEISSMCGELEFVLEDLDVDLPQAAYSNDFSEPLVIAESLVKQCRNLMEGADQ